MAGAKLCNSVTIADEVETTNNKGKVFSEKNQEHDEDSELTRATPGMAFAFGRHASLQWGCLSG
jgi:hypothetical protein